MLTVVVLVYAVVPLLLLMLLLTRVACLSIMFLFVIELSTLKSPLTTEMV